MICEKCGANKWNDVVSGGEPLDSYCPKCEPKKIVILPPASGTSKIGTPKPPVHSHGSQTIGNPVWPGGATISRNPLTSPLDLGNQDDKTIEILADGVPLLTVYEDLPKQATQGDLAYIRGETSAYVFDGDEWQNLGKVARALSGKDANCDRRAAVAATKAKDG